MRFLEIINRKKFALISVFLFLYVILNLLDGERGLISYFDKQQLKNQQAANQAASEMQTEALSNVFGSDEFKDLFKT